MAIFHSYVELPEGICLHKLLVGDSNGINIDKPSSINCTNTGINILRMKIPHLSALFEISSSKSSTVLLASAGKSYEISQGFDEFCEMFFFFIYQEKRREHVKM